MTVELQISLNTSVFHIQIVKNFDASTLIKFAGCRSATHSFNNHRLQSSTEGFSNRWVNYPPVTCVVTHMCDGGLCLVYVQVIFFF